MFDDLLDSHSWSTVKLDLYGLKFYYAHVLHKPWVNVDLIKPPKCQRLPDIVTVDEAKRLVMATRTLSYRVFYFTLYSLGLRLGESLRLQVGDIDAPRQRVHIRDSKGNKDRFVPLPNVTLALLRRFWQLHRNPVLLFPNRHGGLKAAGSAATPLDRGGVQITLRKALAAMKACRTSSSPLMQAHCTACDSQIFVPHSCGHVDIATVPTASTTRVSNGSSASSKYRCPQRDIRGQTTVFSTRPGNHGLSPINVPD